MQKIFIFILFFCISLPSFAVAPVQVSTCTYANTGQVATSTTGSACSLLPDLMWGGTLSPLSSTSCADKYGNNAATCTFTQSCPSGSFSGGYDVNGNLICTAGNPSTAASSVNTTAGCGAGTVQNGVDSFGNPVCVPVACPSGSAPNSVTGLCVPTTTSCPCGTTAQSNGSCSPDVVVNTTTSAINSGTIGVIPQPTNFSPVPTNGTAGCTASQAAAATAAAQAAAVAANAAAVATCQNSGGSVINSTSSSGAVTSTCSGAVSPASSSVSAASGTGSTGTGATTGTPSTGTGTGAASGTGSTGTVVTGGTSTTSTNGNVSVTVNVPPLDLTTVAHESTLQSILNSIQGGTASSVPAYPTFASGVFYTSKYPNGISGVLSVQMANLSATPLAKMMSGFMPTLGGSSAFNGCFAFPLPSGSTFDLCIPSIVFNALAGIFILTTIFVCRGLIFGG